MEIIQEIDYVIIALIDGHVWIGRGIQTIGIGTTIGMITGMIETLQNCDLIRREFYGYER